MQYQSKDMNTKGLQKVALSIPDILIGIDPGTKTGVAVWSRKERKLLQVYTLPIHKAFDLVKKYHSESKIKVRIEDARKRKYFGNSGREKLQGAGSVKRDCSAWQEFLEDHDINFDLISPLQKGKKVTDAYFTTLTGYTARTSQHGRDAAMMVFGF